jgi:hypothetical protein
MVTQLAANPCHLDFTIRTGTIFERSHIPLHKWLYAMYLLLTLPTPKGEDVKLKVPKEIEMRIPVMVLSLPSLHSQDANRPKISNITVLPSEVISATGTDGVSRSGYIEIKEGQHEDHSDRVGKTAHEGAQMKASRSYRSNN